MEKVQHLKIPLKEIKLATNNFSDENFIAQGGFGKVYIGKLIVSGQVNIVAVKRLDNTMGQGYPEFLIEIQILSYCRHKNLTSLFGFCDEGGENILVYEHVKHGSLDKYLANDKLSWMQRLKICLGAARGFNYLHNDVGPQHMILHRDIKSSNILVDENWEAKISDFGLSKICPSNVEFTLFMTNACGTYGYIDPQYRETGILTKESDVYSFGVVLFEIICGRLALDPTYQDERRFLDTLAQRCYEENRLHDIILPSIKNEINKDSLNIFSKVAYECLREKSIERPTMALIEEKLEEALEHQICKLEYILSATNNFSDENLIAEGVLGNVYKGHLLPSWNSIDFAIRRFDRKYGKGDELQMEASMLKTLKHKNIVSTFWRCDKNNEKIIIYEQAFHGTLRQHLGDPTLTWSRRLQICLGVAHALNYIHYDVIHCDISSSKILLDKDWVPKIYGFELSTKYPQSWRHRVLFSHHFDTNNMTPKYDVYCFGVLLLEVLCGRKPRITNEGVQEELDKIIDPNLREQMDTQSLALFTNIAYNCLKQELMCRPTMDQIVKELKEVLELQWKHANLEHSIDANEGASSNSSKMDILKIPLSAIRLATNNFDKAYSVGSGGYGIVYKAKLDVLDVCSLPSFEGKCKDELPKISKTVAIKRIFTRADEQGKQGFLTEIELLTSCHHPNIIPLLGFSSEACEMILVYEYAFKGSLSDYLGSNGKTTNLTWAQRLQICLDIAHGIHYLHTDMEGKPRIIHRDIKSENILLDENLRAKVADFGLSKFHPMKQQASTIYTKNIAGTKVYMDPEYLTTSKYKRESDIYSFGVVLFEVLSGSLAYDSIYIDENDMGLAPIARRRFNEGTLKELIDPKITDEDDDHTLTLNRGPNQDSFDTFSKIAYQCLAETQVKRPTMEAVIKELQKALTLQGDTMVLLKFRLSDIVFATQNFAETYCIGLDWNGMVYKAELEHLHNNSSLATEGNNNDTPSKKHINVAIKRITSKKDGQGKQGFFSEVEMRISYKHPNIVSLLGFCKEGDELIIVYEHASYRSLDDCLKNMDDMNNLTWTHRLRMCLQIARGISHLHTKMDSLHGDIKSANILLDKNYEAKIAYFGISKLHPRDQEVGMKVYGDPEYETTGKLKRESDIYSFGVVLFEIFCGRLAYDPVYISVNDKGLAPIARQRFNDGTLERIIDPRLKKETDEDIFTSNKAPNSLVKFLKIAYKCLGEANERPTMEIVIKKLEKALQFHIKATTAKLQ